MLRKFFHSPTRRWPPPKTPTATLIGSGTAVIAIRHQHDQPGAGRRRRQEALFLAPVADLRLRVRIMKPLLPDRGGSKQISPRLRREERKKQREILPARTRLRHRNRSIEPGRKLGRFVVHEVERGGVGDEGNPVHRFDIHGCLNRVFHARLTRDIEPELVVGQQSCVRQVRRRVVGDDIGGGRRSSNKRTRASDFGRVLGGDGD